MAENNKGNNNINSGEGEFGTIASLPVASSAAVNTKKNSKNANKNKSTKKSRKPLTANQKVKLLEGRAKARNTAKEEAEKALIDLGKRLHGVKIAGVIIEEPSLAQRKEGEVVKVATATEYSELEKIRADVKKGIIPEELKEVVENAGDITLNQIIEVLKSRLAKKVPKGTKYKAETRTAYANRTKRNTYRTALKSFGVAPSTRRLKKFINLQLSRERKANVAENLAEIKEALEAIPIAEKRGLGKTRAAVKAELKELEKEAERELKELRTRAQIEKNTGVNPATVKHLALLRQAKYTITPSEIKALSTMIKKGQDLTKDAVVLRLVEESADKKACDRCLLTTIFGVEVD